MGRGASDPVSLEEAERSSGDLLPISDYLDRFSYWQVAVLCACWHEQVRSGEDYEAFGMSVASAMVRSFNDLNWSHEQTMAHERRVNETLAELEELGLVHGLGSFWQVASPGIDLIERCWENGRSTDHVTL